MRKALKSSLQLLALTILAQLIGTTLAAETLPTSRESQPPPAAAGSPATPAAPSPVNSPAAEIKSEFPAPPLAGEQFNEDELKLARARVDRRQIVAELTNAYKYGFRGAAQALLRRLEQVAPDSGELDYFRAVEAFDRNRKGDALLLARSAVHKNPAISRAWNLQGMILAEAGRLGEAREMYLRAVETSPYNPNHLYNLAMVCYQMGDDAAALETVGRAIRARANFSEAHYLQGLTHRRRGEPRETYRALQRAHLFGLKDARFLLDFMLAADGVGEEKVALNVARDLSGSRDPLTLRETARLHRKYGEYGDALARLQTLSRLPECNFEDLKLYIATALAADQNVMLHISRLNLKAEERRELIAYYETLRNERIEALAPRDPVARSRYRP